MAFAKLWVIAYRDLGRNRRRTLFTLIAVALGVGLLILLEGYIAGVGRRAAKRHPLADRACAGAQPRI